VAPAAVAPAGRVETWAAMLALRPRPEAEPLQNKTRVQ